MLTLGSDVRLVIGEGQEPWPLAEQIVNFESIPPDLARVFVAHGVKTWADIEAEFTEAMLLAYPGVGREAVRWVKWEVKRRMGAVQYTATGKTSIPLLLRHVVPPVAPDRTGIYFVQCGPFVKIGLARSVRKRFMALQQNIPFQLELLGVVEAPFAELRTAERQFHDRFRSAHQHGEWFRLEGELDVFCLTLARGECVA